MGGQEINYQKGTRVFIDHLCHAAIVVCLGRIFLRALFGFLHVAKLLHHHIWLTAGARTDIMWWKCLLGRWSGNSFFVSVPITSHVFSDASGPWGCGAVAMVPSQLATSLGIDGHLDERVSFSGSCSCDMGATVCRETCVFHSNNMKSER